MTIKSAFTSFLTSPPGHIFTSVLPVVAVIFMILMIGHAVFSRHKMGLGAVLRRCLEIVVLCLIFAVPVIWESIAQGLLTFIQAAFTWLGGLL